jgi:hypothetical protein
MSLRALNRATLARQSLLERSRLSVEVMLERLVGMQAQTPHTAYLGLWDRIEAFDPEELSARLTDRSVVRLALMRGTIHLVTARDAWDLRPLVQPVIGRVQKGQFGRRLEGIDGDEVVAMGRAFVDIEPRTFKALGDHLLTRWPDRDRFALEQAVRTGVPLIQVPPRGLWGRSGPIAHTSIQAWLGTRPEGAALTLAGMVRRYLAGFGPASVMDIQAWCGLTKLREVVDDIRSDLIVVRDETGRELFDVPDAPRPPEDTPAPPRFLYDFENLLLSYADRTRMAPPDIVRGIPTGTNEPISTFTLDGFVAGTWKLVREGRATTLRITRLRAQTAAETPALSAEAERLLSFLAPGAPDADIRFADP